MATRRLYFPHIEGLRGLTAFYVFVFHIRSALIAPAFAVFLNRTSLFDGGHFAVAVFIVISGYCLAAPLATAPQQNFDAWIFLRRRFRRIYPAYFAALALSTLSFYYWSAASTGRAAPLGHVAIAFIAHALLIHNLVASTSEYLNVPMWSVGAEVQIYVIFALILVPIWRMFGAATLLAAALVLGFIPHVLLHGSLDWTCPWFIGLFGMGVYAAHLSSKKRSLALWRTAFVGALVLTIIMVRTHFPENGANSQYFGGFIWLDTLVGLTVSLFLVSAINSDSSIWYPARPFALAAFQKLGAFAYSLYLLHFIGIAVTFETLRRMHAGITPTIIAYALLIPLMLGVSFAFYRRFEQPFLSSFLRKTTSRPPEESKLIEAEAAGAASSGRTPSDECLEFFA